MEKSASFVAIDTSKNEQAASNDSSSFEDDNSD